jgi:acetyl esterase/lipase
MLAGDHEGRQVAEWVNSLGVPAFVLKYRLGPCYHHPAMLQDAGRPVRALGQKWGVDPRRIAVLGFSAGGHLASTAGTHFRAWSKNARFRVTLGISARTLIGPALERVYATPG